MRSRLLVGTLAAGLGLFPADSPAQFFGAPPPPPPIFVPPQGMVPTSPLIMPPQSFGGRCATPYNICFMNGVGPISAPCLCPSSNGPVGGTIIP